MTRRRSGVQIPPRLLRRIASVWRIGRCWLAALVLKTNPGKTGEGSIPLSSAPLWWNGRHVGFKLRCFVRVGSSPTRGTEPLRWPSARLAQLVERSFRNRKVAGSIPALGSWWHSTAASKSLQSTARREANASIVDRPSHRTANPDVRDNQGSGRDPDGGTALWAM